MVLSNSRQYSPERLVPSRVGVMVPEWPELGLFQAIGSFIGAL